MNFSGAYGARAYETIGVETGVGAMSPHGLILMLFDGAIKSLILGQQAMQSGRISDKGRHVSKAIEIISLGLATSLDKTAGGQLAESLSELYEYMCRRLVAGNLENDANALGEVQKLLSELRGAWASIESAVLPPPHSQVNANLKGIAA